jgi:hypothetical protein
MKNTWSFEWLTTLVIILIAALFIVPVYLKTGLNYTFYVSNIAVIVIFLLFTKYIFFLRHTPFSRSGWFRFLLIVISIPLFFYAMDVLFNFNRHLDEEGTVSFFKGSQDMNDYNFGKFIRFQFIFFSVAAIVTIVLMPIRMVISFWRTSNTKDRV